MRYTEDYRRLLGAIPKGRRPGNLISGLEGYQGRNLIGGLDEGVLDQLALGFGGFSDLGAFYTVKGGMWPNLIDNRFQADSDAAAIEEFNKQVATVSPDIKLMLVKLDVEGGTSGAVIVEHYGTKGAGGPAPVAVTYQFVLFDKSGAVSETKTATYYSEAEAKNELERQRQFTPAGGRVELRAGGSVIASAASAKAGAVYQIYKNDIPEGSPMDVSEDVAYSKWRSAQSIGWSTDTYKLVKVTTGEVVAGPEKGARVAPVTVQWKVKKTKADGTVEWPVGGAAAEGSSVMTQKFSEVVSTSGSNETVELFQDGVVVQSSKGGLPPVVKYWIAKKTADRQEDVFTVEKSTVEEAKEEARHYAESLPYEESAVLLTADHVEISRYEGTKTKRPLPDFIPESTLEVPAFEEVKTSMAESFEKFKTWATDQALPPVPNGVWVGIGVAIAVGVGVAATTMKK
jgi:hypothetical protein